MKQYKELLYSILANGVKKPAARENMPGTISLFGYQFRHNILKEGFPLLTTKEVSYDHIVTELRWFLRGDTNIKFLVDRNVNIWNEDAYNYYVNLCSKQHIPKMVTFDGFVDEVKNGGDVFKRYGWQLPKNYILGDCGYQYGKVWRAWETDSEYTERTGKFYPSGEPMYDIKKVVVDQIQRAINRLKATPESRRHLVTAVDPEHDNDLALYWCHSMFQFNCREIPFDDRKNYFVMRNKTKSYADEIDFKKAMDVADIPKYYLDCQLYQRSADAFLGVPYNIASYALMTIIFAEECNMIAGDFVHTFGDVHVYENHLPQVGTLLERDCRELPRYDVGVLPTRNYLDAFVNEKWCPTILGYNPHPPIRAKLSTGLK